MTKAEAIAGWVHFCNAHQKQNGVAHTGRLPLLYYPLLLHYLRNFRLKENQYLPICFFQRQAVLCIVRLLAVHHTNNISRVSFTVFCSQKNARQSICIFPNINHITTITHPFCIQNIFYELIIHYQEAPLKNEIKK